MEKEGEKIWKQLRSWLQEQPAPSNTGTSQVGAPQGSPSEEAVLPSMAGSRQSTQHSEAGRGHRRGQLLPIVGLSLSTRVP